MSVNYRSVPVNTDGLAGEYYPDWFLVRLAILQVRDDERYPVMTPPPERHSDADSCREESS